MKILIQRLTDDERISNNRGKGIEEFSKNNSRNVDYMKYKFGSDYVPVEISISMNEGENNREVIGMIDNDIDDLGNAIQEYNRKYKRIWPLHIYPCQKIDLFGAKCTMFHLFKSVDHRCYGLFHL